MSDNSARQHWLQEDINVLDAIRTYLRKHLYLTGIAAFFLFSALANPKGDVLTGAALALIVLIGIPPVISLWQMSRRFGAIGLMISQIMVFGMIAPKSDKVSSSQIPSQDQSFSESRSSALLPTLTEGSLDPFSRHDICRGAISLVMGRPVNTMDVHTSNDDITRISYTRPADGTHWAYRCRIGNGKIVWATDTGRWRDDIRFETSPKSLTLVWRHEDGSSSRLSLAVSNFN